MGSYIKSLKDNRGNIIIPRTTAKVSTYDNTASQLDATNTQDAIDELADGRIKTVAGVGPDEVGNIQLGASDVKAAPSGFGWGDKITQIQATSVDEPYEEYCAKLDAFMSNMPNGTAALIRAYPPALYGKAATTVSILYKSDENYATLFNAGAADAYLSGWRMFKQRYPSSSSPAVWMPFEWENPPMELGIEYRTTERWDRKPVYTQLINFGLLPNASRKTISHNIPNIQKVVDIVATANNGAIMNDMELAGSNFTANNSVIACQSSVDQSSFTAMVLLKYTKTSD